MTKFFPWSYEGEGSYCYNLSGFITTTAHFHAEIKKIIYNWRFTGSGDIHHVHDIHIWGLDMTPTLQSVRPGSWWQHTLPQTPTCCPLTEPHPHTIQASLPLQQLPAKSFYSTPQQSIAPPINTQLGLTTDIIDEQPQFPICHRLAALSSATVWGPLIQDS